ncbi:hypothetical protein VTL71DRAFT_4198 [Oculimacula yallundae]|uniref:Amidase domain-containing protein n=1 Tax=Oculimacula yallundae TaxID=86028 RepID=A0ABR4C539_9HELO
MHQKDTRASLASPHKMRLAWMSLPEIQGALQNGFITSEDLVKPEQQAKATESSMAFHSYHSERCIFDARQHAFNRFGCSGLLNAKPSFEATVIKKWRQSGTVLSGKTILSQWANCRSSVNALDGWSAVGGQCMGIFPDEQDPGGSSAGSAVAVALRLVPVALGTEATILDPLPEGHSVKDQTTYIYVPAKAPISSSCIPRHVMISDEHAMKKFDEALRVMQSLGAIIVDDVQFSEWSLTFNHNPNWRHAYRVGVEAKIEKFLQNFTTNPHNLKTLPDVMEYIRETAKEENDKCGMTDWIVFEEVPKTFGLDTKRIQRARRVTAQNSRADTETLEPRNVRCDRRALVDRYNCTCGRMSSSVCPAASLPRGLGC